jgi:hypothetical protein
MANLVLFFVESLVSKASLARVTRRSYRDKEDFLNICIKHNLIHSTIRSCRDHDRIFLQVVINQNPGVVVPLLCNIIDPRASEYQQEKTIGQILSRLCTMLL